MEKPKTYDFILSLNKFEAWFATQTNQIVFYKQVSTDKEVRDAAMDFEKTISEFMTEFSLRTDIYESILQFKTEAKANGSFDKIDAEG